MNENKYLQSKASSISCRNEATVHGLYKCRNTSFISCNKSKGQLFIIAAVFIVAGLVLIFNVLSSPVIIEEKKFQDVRMLNKNSKNILNEYKYSAGIAAMNSPSNETLMTYIANLSDYYRNEIDSNIFYIAVMLNGSTQRFSVNAGNYMDDRMNINISCTDSAPESVEFSLNDRTSSAVDFLSSGNRMINITLNYTIGNIRTVEIFSLNSSSWNSIMLFLDMKLKDESYEIRVKDAYNWSW